MSKIYLSCEIIQEYINSYSKLLSNYSNVEHGLNEHCSEELSEISSVFLFGYQIGNEFCISEIINLKKNVFPKCINFENNQCIGVFGKLYLVTCKTFKENDVQGFLLKEITFGTHHFCLIMEMNNFSESHGLLILYDRKQFETSVLIKIHKDSFFNAVDFVGNSLKAINSSLVQQSSKKNIPKKSNYICTQMLFITKKIISTFFLLLSIIQKIFYSLPSFPLLSLPSVFMEVKYRINAVSLLHPFSHQKIQKNLFIDFLWKTFIDVIIGLVIFVIYSNNHHLQTLTLSLLSQLESVGDLLERLLDWLEGAPAGLKLNKPLALLLSFFFKNHVMLWKSYLVLIRPFLANIFFAAIFCGIFGFSMQLSVLLDLFSIATLHVYCFYVYAAKLYHFQLKVLNHLWRMFRGKRWNALEGRVEDGEYRLHVMVISTLSFTIILFLLPTTLTFYVVFTCLRMCSLGVHSIVGLVITCLHKNPSYWVLLCFFQPVKLAGKAEIKLSTDFKCKAISLQLVPPSYKEIFDVVREHQSFHRFSDQTSSKNNRNFFYKIFLGDLIFPWVERNARQ